MLLPDLGRSTGGESETDCNCIHLRLVEAPRDPSSASARLHAFGSQVRPVRLSQHL